MSDSASRGTTIFTGRVTMEEELTFEKLVEIGKMWGGRWLSTLSPEELVKAVGIEKILKGMKPEDRLRGLTTEEIEAYLLKLKKKK